MLGTRNSSNTLLESSKEARKYYSGSQLLRTRKVLRSEFSMGSTWKASTRIVMNKKDFCGFYTITYFYSWNSNDIAPCFSLQSFVFHPFLCKDIIFANVSYKYLTNIVRAALYGKFEQTWRCCNFVTSTHAHSLRYFCCKYTEAHNNKSHKCAQIETILKSRYEKNLGKNIG